MKSGAVKALADCWMNSIWVAVTATDRPGLLHALARVFARHEVNLLMAKIMTLGSRVEDSFQLTGPGLHDDRTVLELETDLMAALRI